MLAHLSDLHLRPGDPGPESRLERAVAAVAAMDPLPGALLVSGDLADVPAPEVYARARELLEAAGVPLVVVSGNHDDTAQLSQAFGDDRLEGRAGPLRVVGLDTSRPGQDGGRVEDQDIARLDAVLATDQRTPTVLAMHHPPVPTGVRSLDAIGLPARDRDAVAALLLRHRQVQVVACGHVHRAMATTLGGTAVVIAPGVSSQLRLDLRPEDGHEIEMTAEPAGLMVHVVVGGGIRSHFQVLPDACERVLHDRELNRALLARQGLLERQEATPLEMIDRLVGMQGEEPPFPYVALWSRIRNFDPAALEALLTGHEAVRLWVMRGTIHLTTVADAVSMYPFTQRLHGQSFRSNFAAGLAGADPTDVTAAAVELIGAEPRTKGEIADALQERWPQAERQSLGYCVTHHAPCVQVPPRGLFRQAGQVRLAPLEQWVGRELDPDPSLTDLVWRYLAAFGPASVADMRIWSRITGLREAFEGLRPRLRTFRDKEGRELFDVPDGPLPDADTPAPPRFLPRLENALLGFDDRSRVFDGRGPGPQARKGRLAGVVLVDGFHRANWLLSEDKGAATLFVDGLDAVPGDVEAEARAFLDFWAPDAGRRELVL